MRDGWLFLIAYLSVLSIVGFAFMGADKAKARKSAWRIPERRLFIIAAFGGSIGVWVGMRVFRHKTKHATFRFGVPFILACQAALAFWLITKFV